MLIGLHMEDQGIIHKTINRIKANKQYVRSPCPCRANIPDWHFLILLAHPELLFFVHCGLARRELLRDAKTLSYHHGGILWYLV